MSSPATHLFRLPSEADARTIVNNAVGKTPASEEVKALRNLYKSLDWAYKGLSGEEKTLLKLQYPNIEADLQGEITGKSKTLDAIVVLRALTAAKADVQHPGAQRLRALTPVEKQTVATVIGRLEYHVQEILDGDHDKLIERVFPGESPLFGKGTPPPIKEVKETFKLALAAVKNFHSQNKITVDAYAQAIRVGGLTNVNEMKLSPSFFKVGKSQQSQEATLGHESTHAINGPAKTDDAGGYIGSQMFETAETPVRLKNASHFEAIIRLINVEDLEHATADRSGAEKEAREIVRKAWDKALNLYGELHGYRTSNGGLVQDKSHIEYLMDVSQLFGLPAYKNPDYDRKTQKTPAQVQVTDADLAFLENRVGKLGVLLGAVSRAAEEVNKNTFWPTARKILEKLVEMEGPLRKTTNNQKTVDMILVLAAFSQASVTKFTVTKY